MRTSRCTEQQIALVPPHAEAGAPIIGVFRKYGISDQILYRCKKNLGHKSPIAFRPHTPDRTRARRRPVVRASSAHMLCVGSSQPFA